MTASILSTLNANSANCEIAIQMTIFGIRFSEHYMQCTWLINPEPRPVKPIADAVFFGRSMVWIDEVEDLQDVQCGTLQSSERIATMEVGRAVPNEGRTLSAIHLGVYLHMRRWADASRNPLAYLLHVSSMVRCADAQ